MSPPPPDCRQPSRFHRPLGIRVEIADVGGSCNRGSPPPLHRRAFSLARRLSQLHCAITDRLPPDLGEQESRLRASQYLDRPWREEEAGEADVWSPELHRDGRTRVPTSLTAAHSQDCQETG